MENNSSYAGDLITTTDAYYLLTEEQYTPFANSIVKLDQHFNVVWKVTAEFVSIADILALPNGKIVGMAGRGLMVVESDGSSWSWVNSISAQELHAVLTANTLYIYGLDYDYKPFLAGYDVDLHPLWMHHTSPNRIMAYSGGSEIHAVNTTGDTLRTYTLDGNLIKQFAVKDSHKVFVTDFKVDDLGNRYILGTANLAECCCNDKISISKVSSAGTLEWQRTLGSSSANNVASNLLIADNKVYVSGGYGEDGKCLGEGSDGNATDGYLLRYNVNGDLARFYRHDTGTAGDVFGRITSFSGEIYVAGGGSGADETSSRATIFKIED